MFRRVGRAARRERPPPTETADAAAPAVPPQAPPPSYNHRLRDSTLPLRGRPDLTASAGCSPSPRTLSFLPAADDIQQIDIEDIVRGPEAAATLFPIEARYTLISQGDAFVGRATFSVGSKQPRRAEADVRVPLDAFDQFLRRLSSALLREGYAPQQPPPGGAFPDVRVAIKPRAAPAVVLFTRSPGAQYLPWGVEFDERTYTIESTAPPRPSPNSDHTSNARSSIG